MAFWMRRLGTGTGFACAKLSEVVARSERSLASVRMTEKRLGTVVNDGEKRRERLVALRDQSFAPGARGTELLAR